MQRDAGSLMQKRQGLQDSSYIMRMMKTYDKKDRGNLQKDARFLCGDPSGISTRCLPG